MLGPLLKFYCLLTGCFLNASYLAARPAMVLQWIALENQFIFFFLLSVGKQFLPHRSLSVSPQSGDLFFLSNQFIKKSYN